VRPPDVSGGAARSFVQRRAAESDEPHDVIEVSFVDPLRADRPPTVHRIPRRALGQQLAVEALVRDAQQRLGRVQAEPGLGRGGMLDDATIALAQLRYLVEADAAPSGRTVDEMARLEGCARRLESALGGMAPGGRGESVGEGVSEPAGAGAVQRREDSHAEGGEPVSALRQTAAPERPRDPVDGSCHELVGARVVEGDHSLHSLNPETRVIAEALEGAQLHLDLARDQYKDALPRLLRSADDGLSRLIDASLAPMAELQEWIGRESRDRHFALLMFQPSLLDVLTGSGRDTLVGLLPPPFGPILGFVASAVGAAWSGHQTSTQQREALEQAEAESQWLRHAQSTTTDALLRSYMREQASLVRTIGRYEGALEEIFGSSGGRYAEQIRALAVLVTGLHRMSANGEVLNDLNRVTAGNAFASAVELFDTVQGRIGALESASADLGLAAQRAPLVGRQAFAELLDRYLAHRAAGSELVLSAVARPGPQLGLREWMRLGEYRLSPECRDNVLSKSLPDLARLDVAVTLSLNVESWSTRPLDEPICWHGACEDVETRRWNSLLHLRHAATGARTPAGVDEVHSDRVPALAALVDPEAWFSDYHERRVPPRHGPAGRERLRAAAGDALARLWEDLVSAPLTTHRGSP
jgi:hypothetical protein